MWNDGGPGADGSGVAGGSRDSRRLGWRHKADLLAAAYWSLPQAERAQAAIYTENYGDASAVNVYRPDVPEAIRGHQNYFLWGPRGYLRLGPRKAPGHVAASSSSLLPEALT